LLLKQPKQPTHYIMEKSANYWKEQYFKVYAENRQLRLELETLRKDYEELKDKFKGLKSPTGLLNVPTRKKSMKILSSNDLSHLKTIAGTIVAPAYDILKLEDPSLKGSFKFSASQSGRRFLEKEEEKRQEEEKEKEERRKDKQEKPPSEPDLNPDLYLFEELFIISVSADFKSSTIIGRYPNHFDM